MERPNTMSHKTIEKKMRPQISQPTSKQAPIVAPDQSQDLNGPTLQPSATATTGPLAAAPTGTPKPLVPVAALWPDSAPNEGEVKPPQARQLQTPRPLPAPGNSPVPKPTAPKTAAPPPPPNSRPVPPLNAPATTSRQIVNVSFCLLKPDSKRVSLCGEFNGWSADATPMRRKQGGNWEVTLPLRPGRYQYKFVVDGEWLHDPNARENLPNPHGSLNSVMEVQG
jgi:hypothetical protein